VGIRRRVRTALTWPVGVGLTSWSYLWRTTPIHRRERDGGPEDMPPPIAAVVSRDDIQRPEDGSGPLFHRTYTGAVAGSELSATALIGRIAADPNRVAPRALARFRKARGDEGTLRVGDEFLVHMPGPWDGPVRVVEVAPASFRFATLAGHIEAGQIEWRASDEDELVFQIDSWARSGDRFSAVLHDRLLLAKEVQLHMWTSVVERAARFAGGRPARGVDIDTRRVDASAFEDGPDGRPGQRAA
jgi:hypothetical protein